MKNNPISSEFNFNEKQMKELKLILGDSQKVDNFLSYVQECISCELWDRKNDPLSFQSNQGIHQKIGSVSNKINELVDELRFVNIKGGETLEDEENKGFDGKAYFILSRTVTSRNNKNEKPLNDDFIQDCIDSLEMLSELCSESLSLLGNLRRGDISGYERRQQLFEKV